MCDNAILCDVYILVQVEAQNDANLPTLLMHVVILALIGLHAQQDGKAWWTLTA